MPCTAAYPLCCAGGLCSCAGRTEGLLPVVLARRKRSVFTPERPQTIREGANGLSVCSLLPVAYCAYRRCGQVRLCSAYPSASYKSAAIRVFCAASALCLCVNSFGFPSLRESIFPYAEQVFAFVRAFTRNGGKPGLRPFIRCPPLFVGRQRRGLLQSGSPLLLWRRGILLLVSFARLQRVRFPYR